LLLVLLSLSVPSFCILTVGDYMNLPVVPADARLTYGSDPNQFGDLYLPVTPPEPTYPVLVLLHGGCWLSQYGLSPLGEMSRAISHKGVAVWNLEYRRIGGGGGWPATFQDVANGIDYLRQVAIRYHLNVSNVFIAGHSAGGHLAVWAASRPNLKHGATLYSPNPIHMTGVVALEAIPDLEGSITSGICGGLAATLMGGPPGTYPERYAEGSVHFLSPLKIFQVFFSGAQDNIVPRSYLISYTANARKHGDLCIFRGFNNSGHFEPVFISTEAGRELIHYASLLGCGRDPC